jgi:hypothetical protein
LFLLRQWRLQILAILLRPCNFFYPLYMSLSWSDIPELSLWFLSWFPWYSVTGNKALPNQGAQMVKLKSSLRKCYGHHHDLVKHYRITVSQMSTVCCKHTLFYSSFLSYRRVCYKSITTEATREAGTYYFLFTLGLYKNMHCTILSFLWVLVLLSFYHWQLYCLSFFYLRFPGLPHW